MARNAKLREEHKWAIEKPSLRMQEKIGNTKGSSHALQDMQEKQAWGDP